MDSGPRTSCTAQQLVKYHLPSQEKIKQSLRLVEQWKGEIGALKQELSSADALCAKRMTLESDFEAKMTALRLQTAGTRVRLEKRLNLEQEFLAGIRKVPDEILVEILHQHLGDQLPSRQLASVCKGWKGLIQGTPSFWRNLQASFVTAQTAKYEVAVLQRRIELSRSTLLDVTLRLCDYTRDKSRYDLFKVIAQTGIERWRSLKLLNASQEQAQYLSLEDTFTGTFLSLQSLNCNHHEYSADPCIPIYRLIIQSNPPIKQLTFNGQYISIFKGTSVFQPVRELTAPIAVASQLFPLINLERLNVFGSGYHQGLSDWPPLPTCTCFRGDIHIQQLTYVQRQKVKHFVVSSLYGDRTGDNIDFPELISLSIDDGFRSIESISAPKLTHLEMVIRWLSPPKKENSDTISLLRERPENLILRPISLIMDLALNTTTVLAILRHWSQLRHLTLTLGTEFSWKDAFPTAFTRKKNPVCPELMSLRLILRVADFSSKLEDWKNMLNSIYRARRNTPLQTIEWKFAPWEWNLGGEWHSVTEA